MPELIDADADSVDSLTNLFLVATKPVDNTGCPDDTIGPAMPLTKTPKVPAMSSAKHSGPPPGTYWMILLRV